MTKLSDHSKAKFAQLDHKISDCIGFYHQLLEKSHKAQGKSGSNQAIRQHLPFPPALHHVSPMHKQSLELQNQEAHALRRAPEPLRLIEMRSFVDRPRLHKLELASQYLMAALYGRKVEYFHMLCLDRQGFLKEDVLLSKGVYDASIFSLRLMLEELMRVGASAIVLCHNHPSDILIPSPDDIDCTIDAICAMTKVQCVLLDHIIVGKSGALSLRKSGHVSTRHWLTQPPGTLFDDWLMKPDQQQRDKNRKKRSLFFNCGPMEDTF